MEDTIESLKKKNFHLENKNKYLERELQKRPDYDEWKSAYEYLHKDTRLYRNLLDEREKEYKSKIKENYITNKILAYTNPLSILIYLWKRIP